MHNGRYGKNNITDISYSDASYAFMGAHERDDSVIFRYCDAYADAVFVVGDFNGWDDSLPMERIGTDGVWEVRADKESVHIGDGYKYKIYKNGHAEYRADPYGKSVGNAPYFNSVIVDESHDWRDGEWMMHRTEDRGRNFPVSVYAIDALCWKLGQDGKALPLEILGDEIIPYVKQMGYTHICFCNVFDDRVSDLLHTYFATKRELGTSHRIKSFTERLHGEGIGVILGIDVRSGSDNDIKLVSDSIGYWSENYHVDGVVIMTDENTYGVLELIRERYKDLIVVDGIKARKNGNIDLSKIDGLCDDWRRFAATRALMTYRTVMPFVHITPMGEEIGAEALSGTAKTVDWHLLDSRLNAQLQLFCSKLNYVYLGCRMIWSRRGEITVSGEGCPKGVFAAKLTSDMGEMMTVVNLTPDVHENCAIDADADTYREIFNSDALEYGGSGVVNDGAIKSQMTDENRKIRIRIPPLAATVLISEKI
jgi:1,4-alpha-glucan branching enzyme